MGCTFTELRHMHVPRATCAVCMDRDNLFSLCEPRQILDLIISAYKLTRLGLPLTTLFFPKASWV